MRGEFLGGNFFKQGGGFSNFTHAGHLRITDLIGRKVMLAFWQGRRE
jgi:hypothetical protein